MCDKRSCKLRIELFTLSISSRILVECVFCNSLCTFLELRNALSLDLADTTDATAAINATMSMDDDPLLLVLAADHIIQNKKSFHDAIKNAIPHAERGKLVTFGIIAKSPETGYGYIQRGEEGLC